MRLAGVASFVVVLGVLQSCGGRVLDTSGHADGAGGTGATGGSDAGRAGRGANDAGSAGGSRAEGSVPGTGGFVAGGTFGAGGSAPGASGSGFGTGGSAPALGGSSAALDCSGVGCSDIDLDCKPAFHVDTLPDECCPQCVPDSPLSCELATAKYASFRSARIKEAQALQGCATDGDCAVFGENSRCGSTCGTPIPRVARDSIEEQLYNFAFDFCTQCPKPVTQPCPQPLPVRCIDNACRFRGNGLK